MNRLSLREMEETHGSEWRNGRDSNDRKRWCEINLFTQEVIRRAGGSMASLAMHACSQFWGP